MRSSWTAVIGAVALLASACLERGAGAPAGAEIGADDAAVATTSAPEVSDRRRPDPPGKRDPDAVITVRLEAEPSHLDPLVAGDGLASRILVGDVYEGLLCRGGPLEAPAPCLARAYRVESGGAVWRFELRDNVRFHDGTPLSAADVVRSIEVVARGEIATPLTAELDDLVSVDVSSSGSSTATIIVRFSGHKLDRVGAFARLPIVPAAALVGDLALPSSLPIHRNPIGTGPLRFVSWAPGESIELSRWDGYWGPLAGARTVRYLVVSSRERAYAMARNGKLDLATQLPVGEALDVAALSSSIEVYTYEHPAYLAAVYNSRRPVASTPARRRALTMLLDRRAIIDAILAGRGRMISGPYVAGEADPEIAPLPYAPRRARATFTAGASARILYPSESRSMARIADIWAADARGVVELVATPAPFATVLSQARAGEFDIVLLAFTSGLELDMFSRLHSSQIGGENYGAIADPTLDGLLDEVRRASTEDARIDATRRAHRRIAELAPYAFIASDARAGLVADDVGGLARGDGLAARFLFKVVPSP